MDFFPQEVAPPAPLDQLRPGMPMAEARRLVPALSSYGDEAIVPSWYELTYDLGRSGVRVYVWGDAQRVEHILVAIDRGDLAAAMTARWGPPSPVEPGVDEWRGPVWRARLSCNKAGDGCDVTFQAYACPLTPAYLGPTVQPPGPLRPLRIGMAVEEARRLAPDHVGPWRDTERANPDAGADQVTAFVGIDDDGLVGWLHLKIYDPKAEDILRAAWGESRLVWRHDKLVSCWAAEPWRACITEKVERAPGVASIVQLELEPYLPLARLFSADGPLGDPLIGAARPQLVARFPTIFRERNLHVSLPSHEHGEARLALELDGDVVVRAEVTLSLSPTADTGDTESGQSRARARKALLDALAQRWGPPRQRQPEPDPELEFSARAMSVVARTVDLRRLGEHWSIELAGASPVR